MVVLGCLLLSKRGMKMKEYNGEKIHETEEFEVDEVNVFSICTSPSRMCLYDCFPMGNAFISTDHCLDIISNYTVCLIMYLMLNVIIVT